MPARVPSTDSDPLAEITAPPSDETPVERERRLRAEAEAKRISDVIDGEIDKQRAMEHKNKPLKVLLLGQSESGKSTTLKNFQLMYDPKAFAAERASWPSIIHLNIVRSIHLILDAITHVRESARSPEETSNAHDSSHIQRTTTAYPRINPELLKLQLRLAPLLQVEDVLMRRLAPPGSRENSPRLCNSYADRSKNILKELAVNSNAQWRGVSARHNNGDDVSYAEQSANLDLSDPAIILRACAPDMNLLWNDPTVKLILRKRGLRLAEMAGFFLDSLDRVTALDYVPSDDDILRARLKTLGVSEHRFTITQGTAMMGRDWRVYDVGGHRSLRAAWVPYFDDMDAIIFLAPISCFDQMLAEDPKINCLEDSLNLWISILGNKLLKDTNMILFLNKVDILRMKLRSGIRLADYIVSYGDRPNDFEHAAQYLRRKFAGLMRTKSVSPRLFYCHLTAVTDVRSTKKILLNVKDVLMRRNLAEAALLD